MKIEIPEWMWVGVEVQIDPEHCLSEWTLACIGAVGAIVSINPKLQCPIEVSFPNSTSSHRFRIDELRPPVKLELTPEKPLPVTITIPRESYEKLTEKARKLDLLLDNDVDVESMIREIEQFGSL
jgi:hypothetical protein